MRTRCSLTTYISSVPVRGKQLRVITPLICSVLFLLFLLFLLFALSSTIYANEINHNVYNGTKAKLGELEEVVHIGNCTATVIGSNVILTAAHCRANNSSVSFELQGTNHTGICTRHPDYTTPSYNNDYVLCKINPAVTGTMASIGKGELLEKGSTMTLSGYGRPYSGNLYWGESTVSKISSQDFITSGSVYLGPGDSGGPAFYTIKDRTNNEHHWVVGVNSRAGKNTSFLNRTDLERFKTWALSWSQTNEAEICGINKTCSVPVRVLPCSNEYSELLAHKNNEGSVLSALRKCLERSVPVDSLNSSVPVADGSVPFDGMNENGSVPVSCVDELDAFDELQYKIQEKSIQLRHCL